MPLPWQHSFCHCRKMCLAHLHSKANISAKFHENWSQTEEVVRDARLATDRPTGLATDDTLIPIYPPYTLRVCGMRGYNKAQPLPTGITIPRSIPHQDHYHGIKPLIRTKTCTVGNCPCGELSGYAPTYKVNDRRILIRIIICLRIIMKFRGLLHKTFTSEKL